MDLHTLRAFEAEVKKQVPEFKLGFKDQSLLQRLIGFLLPLSRSFWVKHATTVYPTVYFPSQKQYEKHPWSSFLVLAHEMAHLLDLQAKPYRRWTYLLPQLLAVIPFGAFVYLTRAHAWPLAIFAGGYLLGCMFGRKSLGAFYVSVFGGIIAAGVLAILMTHWMAALLFAGVALLAPWPSPWRVSFELRGYAMNMAITYWALGRVPAIYRTGMGYHFTGSSHYYADWRGVNTRKRLDAVVERAEKGELRKEHPFSVVYSFMRRHKLLHAP